MKAKVKETGKWITVNPCNDGFYEVGTHDIYEPDELDFAAEFDWQSFRREAAKDILCAMLGRVERFYTGVSIDGKNKISHHEDFIKLAIEDADELIKQLREEKK